MNKFLKQAKNKLLLKDSIIAVLGNESCDLDSAVCAISLAFHFKEFKQSSALPENSNASTGSVVPVLNINREELPLKTEVVHFLENNFNIEIQNLICKDEIDFNCDTTDFQLVLVDHHASPYYKSVISVVDHRPFDPNSNLNNSCKQILGDVGSCATLVMDLIKKDVNLDDSKEEYSEVLKLLYGPIVLDTVNFSKDAEKAKPLDFEMVETIEKYLNIEFPKEHRKKLFEDLVQARADVSTLNSLQVLSKDLKIIHSSSDSNLRVAIPGFPILAQDFVQLSDADSSVLKFAEKNNVDVICLMGMLVEGESVRRDLGLIDIRNEKLTQQILEAFETKTPELDLQFEEHVNFLNGKFFEQYNLKTSRKQIMPLIQRILNDF